MVQSETANQHSTMSGKGDLRVAAGASRGSERHPLRLRIHSRERPTHTPPASNDVSIRKSTETLARECNAVLRLALVACAQPS